MTQDSNSNSAEQNIEIWKIKRLIKGLEAARGYFFFFKRFVDPQNKHNVINTRWFG